MFYEFPQVSTEAWEEKIRADLKGADYQKKLVWNTDEGIPVKPYYRAEDLDGLGFLENTRLLRPAGSVANSWTICQDLVPGRDPVEANHRIRLALKGGAQAIRIRLEDTPAPGKDFLDRLLEGVPLGETEILFHGYLGVDALYHHLLDLAKQRGIKPVNLNGCMGADPLGKMASTGIPAASFANLARFVRETRENSPGLRFIEVNGSMIQNAGSTLTGELGFSLAMANEYLAILTGQGVDPQDAVQSMHLSLASGSNYFMEIAKIRAARILWNKICEGYGLAPASNGIRIHSTSSEWNMTLYDPYVNMLRGTTEAMSSILGGADLITVLPYDYPCGNGNTFSDRVARNVQIILRDEAHFGTVADPSAGSYYIESLTGSIAEKAWELFRETEARGGFRKALETGWIQEKVMASKQKKLDRLASGRGNLLGTNAYPDFNETIFNQQKKRDHVELPESPLVPLRPFRAASMFEEIRLATEQSKKRPGVFLFKYGNPAWVTARAAFSTNFFACAGYEIMDQPAFDSIEQGIEAAREIPGRDRGPLQFR